MLDPVRVYLSNVKIIRVVLIAFLLLPQFCEAQLLTKEWWQGSEVQIGTDLYFYGSRKSSNLAMEPLQYLDRAEDNIGLLEDEVSIIRPFDFTGYGIDESMDFSPSEAISLNVKASFVRPIKSDDNDTWVYIGPSFSIMVTTLGIATEDCIPVRMIIYTLTCCTSKSWGHMIRWVIIIHQMYMTHSSCPEQRWYN